MRSAVFTKRIVWLYDGSHWQHPFIVAGVHSLNNAGHWVCVVDRAPNHTPTFYTHLSSIGWPLGTQSALPHSLAGVFTFLRTLWLTIAQHPNIIIVTHPANLLAGGLVAKLFHLRLVYYPFEVYGEEYGEVRWLWRFTEQVMLKFGVDALITQNEARAQIYIQERSVRVAPMIVHNYKPTQVSRRSGKLRERLNLPNDCAIVLYEGNLMEGRCLDKLAESALYLPVNTKLVIMGRVRPWWCENVEPRLSDPAFRQRIIVTPPVQHSELLDYVADADVGVIIYDDKVRNNYYCEPGKLSDYVLAGVPVVVPRFPTISPVVERYGIGRVFDRLEPIAIAQAIISVLSAPKEMWRSALEQARIDLVWESQEAVFLKAVCGP